MADWGMKISRAGYGVGTCSDNQMLFSSSFPTPTIDLQGTVSTSGNETIVSHNYGYFPVFFCSTRPSGYAVRVNDDGILCGTASLRANDSERTNAYYVMQRDITETYTADEIATADATSGTYSADWGFKVSEDGHGVGTADVDDLVSFSGASSAGQAIRHQTIHKTGTASATNGGTTTIAHGLGYSPLFFAWRKKGTEYALLELEYEVQEDPTNVVVDQIAFCNTTNLLVKNDTGSNFEFSYLIFKDPLI